MKTEELTDALVAFFGKNKIWVKELPLGSGRSRADFWTLHPHASRGYEAISFEVKVSVQDFKRDTYEKQRLARLFSDKFFYVTPKGLINKEDIPDWAGLIEYDGKKFRQIVSAPKRDKDAPSWELIVGILRHAGEMERDSDLIKKERNYYKKQVEKVKDRLRRDGLEPYKYGLL